MAASGLEFLPHFADRPALGILELSSIARGVLVADAVVKKAPSTLLLSRPVSGGKHLIMLRGEVAPVEESMAAGRDIAAEKLIDDLELAYAHPQLWPLLRPSFEGVIRSSRWDSDGSESVAIVETATVCAGVHSADAAAKVAEITLRDMRLAVGIAGKAFYTMSGALPDIEAAALAVRKIAHDRLLELEIIPAPADEISGRLIF